MSIAKARRALGPLLNGLRANAPAGPPCGTDSNGQPQDPKGSRNDPRGLMHGIRGSPQGCLKRQNADGLLPDGTGHMQGSFGALKGHQRTKKGLQTVLYAEDKDRGTQMESNGGAAGGGGPRGPLVSPSRRHTTPVDWGGPKRIPSIARKEAVERKATGCCLSLLKPESLLQRAAVSLAHSKGDRGPHDKGPHENPEGGRQEGDNQGGNIRVAGTMERAPSATAAATAAPDTVNFKNPIDHTSRVETAGNQVATPQSVSLQMFEDTTQDKKRAAQQAEEQQQQQEQHQQEQQQEQHQQEQQQEQQQQQQEQEQQQRGQQQHEQQQHQEAERRSSKREAAPGQQLKATGAALLVAVVSGFYIPFLEDCMGNT
ncbi:hypothetical protein, conserved [Eimeria maxima]|uniref:Uncharacterized protein n=1 Tax=Eimeria maxima TaxID=5804 RepID=U6M046_EIMMA|nr:hypothetical protein, conserved [Eimeria maxima]CDJ56478.1 hypothetical protein, conserved [Eimeria maxima]